jgi:hypothetical protein
VIETIKGLITYGTAAVVIIGSMWVGFTAWASPIPLLPDGTPNVQAVWDIAILFGFLGLLVGAATQFLFGSETATRTARATERAAAMVPGSNGVHLSPTPGETVEAEVRPAEQPPEISLDRG